MMQLRSKELIAFVTYSIVKSIGFITPLILSNKLIIQDYGNYEYALNLASIFSMFVGFGVASSLPYFLLTRKKPKYIEVHRIQTVVMGIILLCALGLYFIMPNANIMIFLTAIITISLVFYSNLATIYKITERPAFASVAESVPNLSVLFAILLLTFLSLNLNLQSIMLAIAVSAFCLSIVEATKIDWRFKAFKNNLLRFTKSFKFGAPLIFNSSLMFILVSGPRLVSGQFFSITEVAVYSFFYRLAFAVLIVHQLLVTIFFKKMYQLENNAIDNYFTKIITAIFLIGVTLFFALPPILDKYFVLMQQYHLTYLNIYLALTIQMVLWASIAQLEMIITRELLSPYFLKLMIVIVGCWLGVAFIVSELNLLTLTFLCRVQVIFFFIIFFKQIQLLRKRQIVLHKMKISGSILFILYIVSDRFISNYFLV